MRVTWGAVWTATLRKVENHWSIAFCPTFCSLMTQTECCCYPVLKFPPPSTFSHYFWIVTAQDTPTRDTPTQNAVRFFAGMKHEQVACRTVPNSFCSPLQPCDSGLFCPLFSCILVLQTPQRMTHQALLTELRYFSCPQLPILSPTFPRAVPKASKLQ